MVGPWQVPVADAAVTASSFVGYFGEAMAMGERPLLSLVDSPASGRMAIAEAITNIACAQISKLSDVKLSANWMVASGFCSEDAKLLRDCSSGRNGVMPPVRYLHSCWKGFNVHANCLGGKWKRA